MNDKRIARGRRTWWGMFWTLGLSVAVLGTAACDDLLTVDPDPHFVDATQNPPLLQETMVGAKVDMDWAYDVMLYQMNQLGGGIVAVGNLRFALSQRLVNEGGGQSGGLTGGERDNRGPEVAYYAYVQQAIASAERARERILSGEFEGLDQNSAEYARLSVYRGFEIVWLSDLYCELVLDAQPPRYSSDEGYQIAQQHFEEALSATGVEEEIRLAATAGMARVHRLLGNDAQAAQFAAQVPPDFEFVSTYSTNTFEQTNRVWFRTWGFGEHSISSRFRDLTVDDTGVPDQRTLLVKNPVPPRGEFDDVYAPVKMPSGSDPVVITNGTEMRYIVAEAALTSDPDRTVEIINEIRAERGVDIEWQPQGTGPNEIRDKLIDEKQRTLLVETGVLLGDKRLYLRKYGLDLFHTEIPQGFPVGDITCQVLPRREIDNIEGLS